METRTKTFARAEARRGPQPQGGRGGHRKEADESSSASTLRNAASEATALRSDQPAAGGRPGGVQALQSVAGNRAVCGLLSVGQAKLEVGAAGDRYEDEADALARKVVAALRDTGNGWGASGASAEGGTASKDQIGPEDEIGVFGRVTSIGRAAWRTVNPEVGLEGGTLGPGTEAAINSARRGGTPLDGGVRGAMESAFGADFSQVRVHAGPGSAELNDRVQAKAFTIGSDIFFRDGVPDARTRPGQELLAHELTHTIQQGAARSVAESPSRGRQREELDRSMASSCCGEVQRDGPVIRRHSSWEHSLLGDAKPAALAKIGAWEDLVNQTDKATAKEKGVPKKAVGKVDIQGVGQIEKGEVMHVLVQEMTRVKKWQAEPPKKAATDDAMRQAKMDPDFQVLVVRLPGKTEEDQELVTYGELNTLADFYGNYDAMAGANHEQRHQILQSVRKETFLRLREIYDKLDKSLTKQEKALPAVAGAEGAFKDEKLGKSRGREQVKFAGSMAPDYVSGKAGQIELIMGVQGLGTEGAVNEYGAGLARNACHFVPESWLAWADCHDKAVALATQSNDAWEEAAQLKKDLATIDPGGKPGDYTAKEIELHEKKKECSDLGNKALLQNGFGDHYLQDSYASGHMINKTKIMQWYVEYIDSNNELDYAKDENWRKAQAMAYGQAGLVAATQYDKSKVKGVDPTKAPNAPQNPQSVENIGGDDWQVRFAALGLAVPPSLRNKDSDERNVVEWWQNAACYDTKKRTLQGSALRKMGFSEAAVANLVKDGIVHTTEGVTKGGGYMRGEGLDTLTGEKFDSTKFVLRSDYVPKPETLAKLKRLDKKPKAREKQFQKMAQAVTYADYAEFMSSAFIQKATNALHDTFCQKGLWVKNKAGQTAYKVYGDDKMFSETSSEGTKSSGETANMSRDSILSIINTGDDGGNTTQKIVDRLPSRVMFTVDGKVTESSLEDWHNPARGPGLKDICDQTVFPDMAWSVVQKAAPGIFGRSLGQITRDNPHGSDVF